MFDNKWWYEFHNNFLPFASVKQLMEERAKHQAFVDRMSGYDSEIAYFARMAIRHIDEQLQTLETKKMGEFSFLNR
ncbi:MAG: hypothetical protein COW62_01115 [Zetaproteobacteria bacterium CG17_big_fil_post_rev_8_21_14_2_50_50_13]|nr:MAG: hypothetical protein COW62_01115 [Zetaproteobacteria bacterium CG17_big_fil_post_rev_8_21_14_2_50_50_13]